LQRDPGSALRLAGMTSVDGLKPVPLPLNPCFNGPMESVLTSARLLLSIVRDLIDAVRVRDDFDLSRPKYASRSVAQRLASGLRYIEAYLRRVLLVMALEIEPMLKDKRGPMKRPHGKKDLNRWNKPPAFVILNDHNPAMPFEIQNKFAEAQADRMRQYYRPEPKPVHIGRLYQRLDQLCAIAKNPLARAKRLAYHLARNREGPILAPDIGLRPPSTWNTEARATFFALAHDIVTRSRARPPPLPAVRRCWPTITRLPEW
jgi:hypothetical protein